MGEAPGSSLSFRGWCLVAGRFGLTHQHAAEVDGAQKQRREAAILARLGEDRAGEGEEVLRNLDQQDVLLHRLFKLAIELAKPGVLQLDHEGRFVLGLGVDGDLDATGLALLWLRWLAGLIGLPILLLMSRWTLEIPNTQSATGILYVACLAVILGELTAQLLGMTVNPENPVKQLAQNKIWSEGAS